MSDKFFPIPLPQLVHMTLKEIDQRKFMGIQGSLFYHPQPNEPFSFERYGRLLETPVGVAAGPHTQLSQNIIAAWLCGARYIELKTIQPLDELEVSKPCIDMQDEGFNCEWSQELKVHESFNEYLNAWIIIHILRKEMAFHGPSGTLFNMSVGYNLEGILNENVQWFFSRMRDCSVELAQAKDLIRSIYPAINEIDIPACISDHVTLSTMHGCPPDEIEKIGCYLITEKKLHTTIKLNPTLLGVDGVRSLLNDKLGFATTVPDAAFEHDLKYPDALRILNSLKTASSENGLQFSVKLSNTLESVNHKDVFSAAESMMYMSGRALHPISIRLAQKLQNDFNGNLDISFSAGVDCFNISEVIACGMKPVTVCTDLLKPGGYGRMHQYIANLRNEFTRYDLKSIDSYISAVSLSGGHEQYHSAPPMDEADRTFEVNPFKKPGTISEHALKNLNAYAERVAENPAYHKHSINDPSIKTSRGLGWFDCIHAPCTDTCSTNQDIPEYMYHTSNGDMDAAFETITRTNPFPSVTGMICDHLCQLKCTRINYDEPLQIREIKRFVAENRDVDLALQKGDTKTPTYSLFNARSNQSVTETEKIKKAGKAAIIGAGPAGLSCAWFLKRAGFEVDIFEQKNLPGGMVSAAIPSFRLTAEAIETDIRRILSAGINLVDNHLIDAARFDELRTDYDVLFLAAGAQSSIKLEIPGIESAGVIDPLEFLFKVRENNATFPGRHVVIIGGGNTAMDAARTASRLVGSEGTVTIIYRRTIKEMPADRGEIEAVIKEGINIIELANPGYVHVSEGRVAGLICTRNRLTEKGKDGRLVPVSIPGSEFEISCDTIIPAIGQRLSIDFLEKEQLQTVPGSYKTQIPSLYIGGDALRGASTAINAIADGRKAAEEMVSDWRTVQNEDSAGFPSGNSEISNTSKKHSKQFDINELIHAKSVREYGYHPVETALEDRKNFNLVISSYSSEEARKEASRCLHCDEICNVCVSVCPNMANFGYQVDKVRYSLQKAVLKEDGIIAFEEDKIFSIDQPYQVLNIRDLCNECGNCTTFCPSSGRPFADKPGICLSVKSLNEEGTGFFLSRLPEKQVLIYKENESIRTLTLIGDRYIYETNQVKAIIDPATFSLVEVKFLTPCVREFHFEFAAEMSIILHGTKQMNF